MKIYVREANAQDAATIADIYVTSWKSTYANIVPESHLNSLSAETLAPLWSGKIAAEDETVYIAEHENEIVGFAHLGENQDGDLKDEKLDITELHALYFHPDIINRGLGSEFWGLLEEFLIGKLVVLWILKENQAACHFYIKQGFEQDLVTGTREFDGQSVPCIRYRKLID